MSESPLEIQTMAVRPSQATRIVDLPWDIYVSNLMSQESLLFRDCYNLLEATHSSSGTSAEFQTMLAGKEMDGFWEAKFKSLYPDLHKSLTNFAQLSFLPESRQFSWYKRTRTRTDTEADISQTVANYRREKLRLRLRLNEERRDGFLSQFLASDPTDIRFPSYRDPVGEADAPRFSKFLVSPLGGQGANGYVLFGHPDDFTDELYRPAVEPFFTDVPSGLDLHDVDFEHPAEVLKPSFAVDVLNQMERAGSPSLAPTELANFGYRCEVQGTVQRWTEDNPNSFRKTMKLLKTSASYQGTPLSTSVSPQKRTEKDSLILPVGSLVWYETRPLISSTHLPLAMIGAVIGWTATDSVSGGVTRRNVTYELIPVTYPDQETVDEDPDGYYRTRHNIDLVCNMVWLTKIPDNIKATLQGKDFLRFADSFFDRFDGGRYLIPSRDLAELYPDDQATGRQLDSLLVRHADTKRSPSLV